MLENVCPINFKKKKKKKKTKKYIRNFQTMKYIRNKI